MATRDKIKAYDITNEELEKEYLETFGSDDAIEALYEESIKDFEPSTILKGRIVAVMDDDVIVDVGYKSEGIIAMNEFSGDEKIEVGVEVEVLLETVEDSSGQIALSKRKADRIRSWERIITTHKENDVISGIVTRKIKGGLLVDIGVPVFLPASQIDIRRPAEIADYIGQKIEAKILKIDEPKRNIVISRRKLIEEERSKMKDELLSTIEVNQIRKGVVKNIADFGAFVDLGGIDGLLHVSDMSWGRVNHPSEIVKIDQEIEIKILDIDREKEKISLGLKHLVESPWINIEDKYPRGSRHRGEVVSIVNYGAFVKLEEGVEGLVHISEMSWTRRVNHPNELVSVGDIAEVIVLDINTEKQEISLGMKQAEENPWTLVEERYPPGTVIEGVVRNLTNYGAFIELEEGIDGLLHVSDMSWTKKINHPSELIKKGEKLRTIVLSVDKHKKRVALGLKQLHEDPWNSEIPSGYKSGDIIDGEVTKITSFGVFVELEEELEGLLHISELADYKVENPEEIVSIGKKVRVKILRVDTQERKIGLSLRQAQLDEGTEPASGPSEPKPATETEASATDETEAATEAPVADVEPDAPVEADAEPEAPAEVDVESEATAETDVEPEATAEDDTEQPAAAAEETPEVAVEEEEQKDAPSEG